MAINVESVISGSLVFPPGCGFKKETIAASAELSLDRGALTHIITGSASLMRIDSSAYTEGDFIILVAAVHPYTVLLKHNQSPSGSYKPILTNTGSDVFLSAGLFVYSDAVSSWVMI